MQFVSTRCLSIRIVRLSLCGRRAVGLLVACRHALRRIVSLVDTMRSFNSFYAGLGLLVSWLLLACACLLLCLDSISFVVFGLAFGLIFVFWLFKSPIRAALGR